MSDDQHPVLSTRTTARRLARWGIGLGITGLRWAVTRVPLFRRDREDVDDDLPDLDRDLPGDPDVVQRASDGVGPLYHRQYMIHMTDCELGPEELIARIVADPNSVTPNELARFEDGHGEEARDLEVGDELVVRLPGPWDGPVRVVEVTDRSLSLVTLRGHLEAGEIRFSAYLDDREFLRFQIDSWARSGDRLFNFLYHRFPVGREMQLHMWTQFCRRAAKISGGVLMSNVTCVTHEVPEA